MPGRTSTVAQRVSPFGGDWFRQRLERRIAPAPTSASQLCKETVCQLLNRHRILRRYAGTVLGTLRKTTIRTTGAVAEAACIQLRSHMTRLSVVSRELWETEMQLNKLHVTIGGSLSLYSPLRSALKQRCERRNDSDANRARTSLNGACRVDALNARILPKHRCNVLGSQ